MKFDNIHLFTTLIYIFVSAVVYSQLVSEVQSESNSLSYVSHRLGKSGVRWLRSNPNRELKDTGFKDQNKMRICAAFEA
ncbi:hypothetical protein CEXT_681921 [Caerostris extrusa]|uniref:Uncharacterized protein n=1 Tax=Caerostris extrusa TaxID=172846 RepID=A0AAV4XCD5_CAEEX|nr:hypothetical protein CEXT_681921 [Caerostris extrusa]